jgi:hypothetical protein
MKKKRAFNYNWQKKSDIKIEENGKSLGEKRKITWAKWKIKHRKLAKERKEQQRKNKEGKNT